MGSAICSPTLRLFTFGRKRLTVAKDKLGTKRVCPDTGRKFYDLNKDPVVSPYTGKSYPLTYFLESASVTKVKKEQAAPEAEGPDEAKDDTKDDDDEELEEDSAVEIVSLEDSEDDDDDDDDEITTSDDVTDDDIPDIPDVDLDEEEDDDAAEDDIFLDDEDEDDAPIPGVVTSKDDEDL